MRVSKEQHVTTQRSRPDVRHVSPMEDSLKEKEDEIKHKDFCVEEFNSNELQTEKKERSKQDLIAKINDLEQNIKQLTEAIDKLKAEIAEMQVQMKRAGEDREKENKECVASSGGLAI